MYVRNVSFHLKSNMQSDYTRTFENQILPLLQLRQHRKLTNKSWRVDETYVRMKGRSAATFLPVELVGGWASVGHNNVYQARACVLLLLHALSLVDWIDDLTSNSDHSPSF